MTEFNLNTPYTQFDPRRYQDNSLLHKITEPLVAVAGIAYGLYIIGGALFSAWVDWRRAGRKNSLETGKL